MTAASRFVKKGLERVRPIWFGGQGRREEDFDQFFAVLDNMESPAPFDAL